MGRRDKAARSAYNRTYSQRNADTIREQHRKYRAANLTSMRERDAAYCRAVKMAALLAYGGPKCCLCSEERIGTLTIDHPAGDGGEQRRTTSCASGKKFYAWLKRHNYPPGYRVLCSNCNWRHYIKLRQTSSKRTKYALRQQAIKARKKAEVMTALGGRCATCGTDDMIVLTVHHINNDGAEHRRALSGGASGYAFYCAVLQTGSFDGLECRCYSCNDAEEWS